MDELVVQHGPIARLFARGALVKICGLREPEHAAAAAAAGADLIGFIFAPTRRQVTAAAARACIEAARAAAPDRTVLAVGVFVDAPLAEMTRIVEEAGIDVIQLPRRRTAGDTSEADGAGREGPAAASGDRSGGVRDRDSRLSMIPTPPLGILIDGYSEAGSGGTGVRADWQLTKEIGAAFPILLSGGLDSRNVGAAIRQVRPLGVDVSSGVEVGGVKTADRIEEFIQAACQAFQRQAESGY